MTYRVVDWVVDALELFVYQVAVGGGVKGCMPADRGEEGVETHGERCVLRVPKHRVEVWLLLAGAVSKSFLDCGYELQVARV